MQTVRKTRAYVEFPLLTQLTGVCPWEFSVQKNRLGPLIKTGAESSSHNKAIQISTTNPILHEATIRLQKSSIFNFHKVSKFSAIPARS